MDEEDANLEAKMEDLSEDSFLAPSGHMRGPEGQDVEVHLLLDTTLLRKSPSLPAYLLNRILCCGCNTAARHLQGWHISRRTCLCFGISR